MTLYDKIIVIYPDLTYLDFGPFGTIWLRDDSDGNGEYIEKWEHPDYSQPTKNQLDAIK